MLDILMIAHFCGDFDGRDNNRFNYIADLLSKDFAVELVTSDFSHTKKIKRDAAALGSQGYKVTLIAEPGYDKNVSLRRFLSHRVMGKNLKEYLKKRKKPDVIYCGAPSLDAAREAARYAEKNGIRFIIDIQDIWPEAFKMVLGNSMVSDIIFYPLSIQADNIYRKADAIVAVSQTYADRAVVVSQKCSKGYCIFLGTRLDDFDRFVSTGKIEKPEDEIWVAYIGTLGHSYDLATVINALAVLEKDGVNNIKFIVMGDGPLKQSFENDAKRVGIPCDFTGRLAYPEMARLLSACDIAVNPISHGAAASIVNKVGDYAAAGLPVLNTQECKEYRKLLEEYNAGLNCESNNSKDLAYKLKKLIEDIELRLAMGRNSRRLAEEKFDRERTYLLIADIIRGIG